MASASGGAEDTTVSVRQIDAHEATVRTATVEVKTLTINGKQVTLAVFRQLIDAEVIDTRGMLPRVNGQTWGSVNYHPDKCAEDSEHLHVVWQQGDHLRRAYLSLTKRTSTILSRQDSAQALFVLACALRVLEGDELAVESSGYGMREQNRIVVGGDPKAPGTWWVRNVGSFEKDTFNRLVEARDCAAGRATSDRYTQYFGIGSGGRSLSGPEGAQVWIDEHMARLRQEIQRQEWRDTVATEQSSRAVMTLYRSATAENDAFEAEYGRLIDEMKSLDQLFIAV